MALGVAVTDPEPILDPPSPIAKAPVRSLILLGSVGDVEVTWEEHNDAQMRAAIESMMERGITFFALKDGVPANQRRKKIGKIGQLGKDTRAVSIPDPDIVKLVEGGQVDLHRSTDPLETSGVERDPEKVAKGRHAAIPRPGGG